MIREVTENQFIDLYMEATCRWDAAPDEALHMAQEHCRGALGLLAWEDGRITRRLVALRRDEEGLLRAHQMVLEDGTDEALHDELLPWLCEHYAGETYRIWIYGGDPMLLLLANQGFAITSSEETWICAMDRLEQLEEFEDAHVTEWHGSYAHAFAAMDPDWEKSPVRHLEDTDYVAYLYRDDKGIAGGILCSYEGDETLVLERLCCRDGWNPAIQEALLMTAMRDGWNGGCQALSCYNAKPDMLAVMEDLGFKRCGAWYDCRKKL